MAWQTVGYKKISSQGGTNTFCLTIQADYSLSGQTYTVNARMLMLAVGNYVPYYQWAHKVTFNINNVSKYNGSLNEPNTSGDWSTSYAMSVGGTSFSRGCLIGSWSQSVTSSGPAISCPISGSYSVSGSQSYLPTKGTHSASGSITLPATFISPSFTSYEVTSMPSTAYVNVPYQFTTYISCNYGTSKSNNLLYWGTANGGLIMASTTGTSLNNGQIYTFSRNQIGNYYIGANIRYTNANGGVSYLAYPASHYLTVSFLNPTLTGVSHRTNATNYYRTSTITTTSGATVNNNSDTPTIYVYFSAPDAAGDGSGQGFYSLGTFGFSMFSNQQKSYVHQGSHSGTFYTRLSLRGYNASNTWTEYVTYGQTSYTMQPFVTPTANRTVTYNKNNVYVGQTKFPVTVTVSSINKSQYDTLTPTFALGPRKNGSWSYDSTVSHAWATGTYNYTLSKTSNAYVAGDVASFCDEMTYKDVDNANAYSTVSTKNYTVLSMPQPTAQNIQVEIIPNENDRKITGSIQGDFDSDFVCYYTMYIENENGSTTYATFNGTLNSGDYKEHSYTYSNAGTEYYHVRVVCYYALADETSVTGPSATFTTDNIMLYGGARLRVKYGSNTAIFYLTNNYCPKPRLAIKYGSTIRYLPIFSPELLPAIEGAILNINGYQARANYVPDTNSNKYLHQYTHRQLSQYKLINIRDGRL